MEWIPMGLKEERHNYYLNNKDKWKVPLEKLPEIRKYKREFTNKRNGELKLEVYGMLGGKCCRCGYCGPALQIDHIKGKGKKERRQNGSVLYNRVKKSLLAGEKNYQLLCANCNWEKRQENKEASDIRPWKAYIT